MIKKPKIYELYDDGWGKPTCKSICYGGSNKTVWCVAAVSIKQAYYLAANNIWMTDDTSTGIVAHTRNAAEEKWQHWDKDEMVRQCPYKHGRVFTKKEKHENK